MKILAKKEVEELRNKIIIFTIFIIIFSISIVNADDWYDGYGSYYKVYNIEDDTILFQIAREVSRGDKYISSDNKMYEITKVNKKDHTAYGKFIKEIEIPRMNKEAFAINKDNDELPTFKLAQNEVENRKVGIYATHSAESYMPSDGTESTEGGGGILKVANKLKENFENYGVEAIFDETLHEPHDAGAYKRSRRTAVQLIRDAGVYTLIDVHRDAVPAEEYLTEIEGKPATMVRLVVGRRNQNFPANEQLAIKIKGVADEMYPGLVKDIFYAKGDYNQDLTPRAILVEMGTYDHTRERAEVSTEYLSEVMTIAIFGGVEEGKENEVSQEDKKVTPINFEGIEDMDADTKSPMKGAIGLIAVVLIGGLIFLFVSNSGQELKSKVLNLKQGFGGFSNRGNKK